MNDDSNSLEEQDRADNTVEVARLVEDGWVRYTISAEHTDATVTIRHPLTDREDERQAIQAFLNAIISVRFAEWMFLEFASADLVAAGEEVDSGE